MTFRLPLLLYVMAVLAAFLATFGPGGLIGFVIWGGIGLAIANRSSKSLGSCFVELLVTVAILFVLIACLLPAVRTARPVAYRVQCTNNLKQLALALLNYEAQYDCFPPAYVADAEGTPMHSWRVLILPYLEQQALYDQYVLREPWNGPNNRKLAAQMPSYFLRCPSDRDENEEAKTNYVAVVGPQTILSGGKGRTMKEITDGVANTLLLVETVDAVPWMEPRDITFDQAVATTQRPCVSSKHFLPRDNFFVSYDIAFKPIGNVAMADGHIDFLAPPRTPEAMRAMLTVSGGELPEEAANFIEEEEFVGRWNWRNIISLAILIGLIFMPLFWRPWQVKTQEIPTP
ncbi:MAG: DUF1559 domain-containing protein [Planctomycetales bacterium]|nr:DUF1559 domain-containing protein [Planctomycetales bacterium]